MEKGYFVVDQSDEKVVKDGIENQKDAQALLKDLTDGTYRIGRIFEAEYKRETLTHVKISSPVKIGSKESDDEE